MHKNVISLMLVVCMALTGLIGCQNNEIQNGNNNNNQNTENFENKNQSGEDENITENVGKTLVVYFSAQSHTKKVAEKIAENLNADIFEIVPEDEYTSKDLDWTDNNSRVSKEHDEEKLRDIKLKSTQVENWDDYDTVLIGYPIWWGIAAWPVNTFVKSNNFDGRTVIPFCTSASSGLGQSGKLLKDLASTGNWQDGHRFGSNASDADISEWTESLNIKYFQLNAE